MADADSTEVKAPPQAGGQRPDDPTSSKTDAPPGVAAGDKTGGAPDGKAAAKSDAKPADKPKAPKKKPAAKVRLPPVLIADEQGFDVELIKRIALEESCEVFAYSRANGLVAEIGRIRPFVVFLDRKLKNLNLLQVCRQCRMFNAAVVLAGQFTSRNEIILAANMGVIDILVKPLAPEIVAPKIVQALAHAKEVLHRKMEFHALAADVAEMSGEEKIRKLLEQAQELMALPQTSTRIIELSSLQNTNAEMLTRVAEVDPAISAMLLKRANSAAYGAMSHIKSLQDAIVRLGFRMVRSIATLMSVFKLSDASAKSFGFNRLGHWVHSLSVGVIAEALATQTKYKQTEDVLLAGVLHDFGKLCFDDYLHDDYTQVFQLAHEKRISVRDAEAEYFGTPHDQIGSHVAKRWQLPETIVAAIAQHHARGRLVGVEPGAPTEVAGYLYAADQMAKALVLGDSGDAYAQPLPPEAWTRLGLDQTDLRDFAGKVVERVTELVKWLNIPQALTGLAAPMSAKDKWVCLVDGGAPDRVLELFFVHRGYAVTPAAKAAEQKTAPTFVVLDRRGASDPNAAPPAPDTWTALKPAAGAIVIKEAGGAGGLVPEGALVLTAPLDYLALLQGVHDKGA